MSRFLDWVTSSVASVNEFLWGEHTFIALLGTGVLFSVWSKFIQYRALTHGVQVVRGKYDSRTAPGAINHFQALSAALSGTVGLGNIGGVALAVGVGGPGAVFWMWVTGVLGMAIKAVEVTLAMMYRDLRDPDNPHGGAMFVIDRGLGHRGPGWRVVARGCGIVFCITLLISGITGGDMFQAWNVADITNQYFGVPNVLSGIILALLTGLVVIGGIRRIGNFAGRIVPLMCGLYVVASLVVLFMHASAIPRLLWQIVSDAFNPNEAAGAFLGASAWFGVSTGLRRALFSNEAGQGSSPIAHAAAKTHEPVREGVVAGLEPFIDTCIVCTLTALVILATGTWNREAIAGLRGEVRLVRDHTAPAGTSRWSVEGPRDASRLPALPAPDSWEVGNGFFLLAEATGAHHRDTASNRVKVVGTIARASRPDEGLLAGAKVIEWSPVELSAAEWPGPPDELRLIDTGIYRDLIGAALAAHAFDRAIPSLGKWLVTITAWLFALSTIISWAYYGEQGIVYIFGGRGILLYKVIYCGLCVVATLPGFIETTAQLENLADLGTGVMLYANLPIIWFMGHAAMRAFRDYFRRFDAGEMSAQEAPPITDVIEGRNV